MFDTYRENIHNRYSKARAFLIANPQVLIDLEKYISDYVLDLVNHNIKSIKDDYDEASYLYPFWQNYPPDDRGRSPRGDQFPWIEVGEHVVGDKIGRLLAKDFVIRDTGIPTGPDKRFVIQSDILSKITNGFTDSIWLFIDIKSVGPRDDFEHTVMSHNQISGNGHWQNVSEGIRNSVMKATGKYRSHEFHCSIPPLYVLSNGTIVPVILVAIKPVYSMISNGEGIKCCGQPLQRVAVISIPNGLLLEENPAYLKMHPGLLFPGKDDKGKNPLKIRCRISFKLLNDIADWRVRQILVD